MEKFIDNLFSTNEKSYNTYVKFFDSLSKIANSKFNNVDFEKEQLNLAKNIKELINNTDLEGEICKNDYTNIYSKNINLKSKINTDRLKCEINKSLQENGIILTCNLIGFINVIAHKVKASYIDEMALINKKTLDEIERKVNEILNKKLKNKYYKYDSKEIINSLDKLDNGEYIKVKNSNIIAFKQLVGSSGIESFPLNKKIY